MVTTLLQVGDGCVIVNDGGRWSWSLCQCRWGMVMSLATTVVGGGDCVVNGNDNDAHQHCRHVRPPPPASMTMMKILPPASTT